MQSLCQVKAVVIGLGAGLLTMFLHGCMQSMQIEGVELDPVMLNLARDYFGFTEDKRMKLEGEVNLVLFGLCSESHIEEDCIPDAALKLDKLLKSEHPEISQSITDAAKKLKRLKTGRT
ncbi:hypothetical protein GOBAR_AA20213 [Gossypium barbadense]|uniref:PABS domain-containing protein n=1 Tax=Gossypium barbadense TaxID=3634 RepID=A0A2P5XAT4_GOSBA|nr:hypothetical protein GOBAR_AA20213 [Gossypium barbadense]